jgi:hypothetical protein
VLQPEQGAEHVGVEHGAVAVRRLLGQRARLAFGAGIVDGDVEPAEPCDRFIDKAAHIVFAAYVVRDERGLGAKPAQLGFERPALGFAAARGDHSRAFPGEGERGGAADAGQRAGDENDRL